MATAIETWFFAVAVVRDGGRFVLVQEPDGSWGLPGGRLEVGESFFEGGRREVREEAGIDVAFVGILEFEHTPLESGQSRMGVAFVAHATDGAVLKTEPDEESLGAAWFELADLDTLRLRSSRVLHLVRLAFSAPPLLPLERLFDRTGRW